MIYRIGAFGFQGDHDLYDPKNGNVLPPDYGGLAMVYSPGGYQHAAIFETRIDESSERLWKCLHVFGFTKVEYIYV